MVIRQLKTKDLSCISRYSIHRLCDIGIVTVIFMLPFPHLCTMVIGRIYHAGFLQKVNGIMNANAEPSAQQKDTDYLEK